MSVLNESSVITLDGNRTEQDVIQACLETNQDYMKNVKIVGKRIKAKDQKMKSEVIRIVSNIL